MMLIMEEENKGKYSFLSETFNPELIRLLEEQMTYTVCDYTIAILY